MTDGVTIGQAAAFAGVTVKTVRHYHKQGERALLPDRVLAKLDKVAADLGFTPGRARPRRPSVRLLGRAHVARRRVGTGRPPRRRTRHSDGQACARPGSTSCGGSPPA
ncbi:MerR family transcriptional regulator [Nonomuraea thailandensis]|uniref:MerR family transcriptional regulator n=1 Tax=Nonomuraea thailandensis TaxID=1188745 RepID=UPI0035588C14